MGYPPSPPYNPVISKVPLLDSSSGDSTASRDPKSIASIGSRIQAMQDQANADRLYDAPLKETGKEGFENPWITKSRACRRIEGFEDMSDLTPVVIASAIGALLILGSFLS